MLDCLGTLLELEPPGPRLRAELALRGAQVSERAAAEAFRREIDYYLAHHLEGSDERALARLRDACARVIADALELGPGRLPAARAAMLAALRFSPTDDAGPMLRALRARGLDVVVASNWDCSLRRVLEGAGLAPLIDAVVASAEVGVAKPDPALFSAALRAVGARPEEAVCVGDSPERDVEGARAAGIAAILLDRRGDLGSVGDVPRVRSLDEALSLILARA